MHIIIHSWSFALMIAIELCKHCSFIVPLAVLIKWRGNYMATKAIIHDFQKFKLGGSRVIILRCFWSKCTVPNTDIISKKYKREQDSKTFEILDHAIVRNAVQWNAVWWNVVLWNALVLVMCTIYRIVLIMHTIYRIVLVMYTIYRIVLLIWTIYHIVLIMCRFYRIVVIMRTFYRIVVIMRTFYRIVLIMRTFQKH